MIDRPEFQQRHHDYVFGPNQDARLASVAAGARIIGMKMQIDTDAPFELRAWSVRQQYTAALTQNGLQFLSVRFTGPAQDYRQQALVPATLSMPNFGQVGNPRPLGKPIRYPANGVIMVDIYNAGASAITNLTFFFRGVKLFPWGAVPAYTYPENFASLSFSYPIQELAMQPTELRQNQIFQCKADADFVFRGGQATRPHLSAGPSQFSECGIVLKDWNGKPYSNDFVPLDVMFGSGSYPSVFPIGATPSFLAPFGTGPAAPGLVFPEIYVPKNQQLWYDLYRNDVGATVAEDVTINLMGSKVFAR